MKKSEGACAPSGPPQNDAYACHHYYSKSASNETKSEYSPPHCVNVVSKTTLPTMLTHPNKDNSFEETTHYAEKKNCPENGT